MNDDLMAERIPAETEEWDSLMWPAVIVTDPAGRVVHWNARAAEVYGWPTTEAVGRLVSELIAPGDPDEAAAGVLTRVALGEPWEGVIAVRRRDGEVFEAYVRDAPIRDADGELMGMLGMSVPHRPAGRAEATGNYLARLQSVTAALSAALSTYDVAQVLLGEGLSAPGAATGGLWLLDEAGKNLQLVGGAGMRDGVDAAYAGLPIEAPMPGPAVFRSGQPLFLHSRVERDRLWPAIAGTETAAEGIAVVPLSVGTRVLGCLALGFTEVQDFDDEQQRFLAALADQAAQAVERARLIDAEREATRRLAVIAEAGRLLAESLDPEVVMNRLAELGVDVLGEMCVIDVVGDDGQLRRTAMAHADPDRLATLRALWTNSVAPPGSAPETVLRTGEPKLVEEITEAVIRRSTDTEEHYRAALALAPGPAAIVPLQARGRIIGVLTSARRRGAPTYTEADLEFVMEIAARAALALDNARLFRQRSDIARTLQQSLLPPTLPSVPGVEMAARYHPAGEGLEVGGDIYDVFAVRDGWGVLIGDVVGTGARAAATTSLVRHTARAIAPHLGTPGEVVRAVNRALSDAVTEEGFCTLVFGVASRTAAGLHLDLAGGGHPCPVVLRADGTTEEIGEGGCLLGPFTSIDTPTYDVDLAPGDALVLYTDGLIEARRPGGTRPASLFGEEGLHAVLRSAAGGSAEDIAGTCVGAVVDFAGGLPDDDIALLVLRCTP